MPAYFVTLDPTKSGHTLPEGANAMVVFAEDATHAKEICSSRNPGDGAAWTTDGTATEVVQDADWVGWTFEVSVLGGLGGGGNEAGSAIAVGTVGDNTIDEIAALLVIACNALTGIANSSYDAATNILTIASIADGLGDQTVQVKITPPGGDSEVPALVGTIVDEGIAGAVLTLVLPADTAVIPIVAAVVTNR